MAVYTSTIQEILTKEKPDADLTKISEVLKTAKEVLFNEDMLQFLPEEHVDHFVVAFTLHYMQDEIGLETFTGWQIALLAKLMMYAEYINLLYENLDKQVFATYRLHILHEDKADDLVETPNLIDETDFNTVANAIKSNLQTKSGELARGGTSKIEGNTTADYTQTTDMKEATEHNDKDTTTSTDEQREIGTSTLTKKGAQTKRSDVDGDVYNDDVLTKLTSDGTAETTTHSGDITKSHTGTDKTTKSSDTTTVDTENNHTSGSDDSTTANDSTTAGTNTGTQKTAYGSTLTNTSDKDNTTASSNIVSEKHSGTDDTEVNTSVKTETTIPEVTTTTTTTLAETTTTTTSDPGNVKSIQAYSDTPQTGLTAVTDNNYLTNATVNYVELVGDKKPSTEVKTPLRTDTADTKVPLHTNTEYTQTYDFDVIDNPGAKSNANRTFYNKGEHIDTDNATVNGAIENSHSEDKKTGDDTRTDNLANVSGTLSNGSENHDTTSNSDTGKVSGTILNDSSSLTHGERETTSDDTTVTVRNSGSISVTDANHKHEQTNTGTQETMNSTDDEKGTTTNDTLDESTTEAVKTGDSTTDTDGTVKNQGESEKTETNTLDLTDTTTEELKSDGNDKTDTTGNNTTTHKGESNTNAKFLTDSKDETFTLNYEMLLKAEPLMARMWRLFDDLFMLIINTHEYY